MKFIFKPIDHVLETNSLDRRQSAENIAMEICAEWEFMLKSFHIPHIQICVSSIIPYVKVFKLLKDNNIIIIPKMEPLMELMHS